MSTEIKITEVEVNRLNVKPGEVLFFKYKGEFKINRLLAIRDTLKDAFPDNKVVVMGLPEEDDLVVSTVRPE